MAAVSATEITTRQPVGDLFLVTVRTSALGDNAADEWIAAASLRLSWIVAVIGVVPIGAAPFANTPSFMKNAQGTGVAEGTNAGDLGIEVEAAADNILEVTVLGRP
jgi:hypothetical protein